MNSPRMGRVYLKSHASWKLARGCGQSAGVERATRRYRCSRNRTKRLRITDQLRAVCARTVRIRVAGPGGVDVEGSTDVVVAPEESEVGVDKWNKAQGESSREVRQSPWFANSLQHVLAVLLGTGSQCS